MARTKSFITPAPCVANWRQANENSPIALVAEAKLYTDAMIVGELRSLGPYDFLNTIAHAGVKRVEDLKPAIVLRIAACEAEENYQSPIETDDEHYHGGDIADELAALGSLFLGIRLKAGPFDREFESDGDPYGRPVQWNDKPVPQLSIPSRAYQIPNLLGQRNVESLSTLAALPLVKTKIANALVRAARLYQEAVWIADADPAMAWLLLVAAVETAAEASAAGKMSATDRVRLALPKVVKILRLHGADHLLDLLSKELASLTGSTEKFVSFLVQFLPDPPMERPEPAFQLSYEEERLKKAFRIIYNSRSRVLHGGKTFPLPMCYPPLKAPTLDDTTQFYSEIPFGLGMRARHASWAIADTPMLLHTFEHIARNAITRWWAQACVETAI